MIMVIKKIVFSILCIFWCAKCNIQGNFCTLYTEIYDISLHQVEPSKAPSVKIAYESINTKVLEAACDKYDTGAV